MLLQKRSEIGHHTFIANKVLQTFVVMSIFLYKVCESLGHCNRDWWCDNGFRSCIHIMVGSYKGYKQRESNLLVRESVMKLDGMYVLLSASRKEI